MILHNITGLRGMSYLICYQLIRVWKIIIKATEIVTVVATVDVLLSSKASGMSSAKTIQIMAPPANPSPMGRYSRKISTNRKAGTAISGWGKLEKMLHHMALSGDAPRGISTRLIASPSGIL